MHDNHVQSSLTQSLDYTVFNEPFLCWIGGSRGPLPQDMRCSTARAGEISLKLSPSLVTGESRWRRMTRTTRSGLLE